MTTSLSNIKVTDGTNNMIIKADDITLNGTSVLVDSATWGNIDGTLSDQTDLNTALNNKQDEATAVNYDNITNCITEIPQDIKLTLSADKKSAYVEAGTKMYYPDGFEQDGTTKKFTTITLTTQKIIGLNSNAFPGIFPVFFRYNQNDGGNFWANLSINNCVSSSSLPANGYEWYDTTNNREGYVTNGTLGDYDRSTFPLGILTVDSSGIITDVQTFNGFGYIGNTIFSLPDVKGLVPNGRNSDGSMQNIEKVNDTVLTFTFDTGIWGDNFPTAIGQWGLAYTGNTSTFIGGKRPENPTPYLRWYNIEENYWEVFITDWERHYFYLYGKVNLRDGKVTALTLKTPFHAVDYNDFADLKEEVDNISVATDDTTISKNTSNQLQAIGIINKNTANGAINPKYDWVGTLAEYNAQSIATSHPTWICYITDDITGGTSVYTKNEMDTLLDDKLDADRLQVVSVLPASPDPNTFYFVTD